MNIDLCCTVLLVEVVAVISFFIIMSYNLSKEEDVDH